MDPFQKTEAQRLGEIERKKRRVQRIEQVRQQTNSWSAQSRQNVEAEKERNLRALIAEVTAEVTDQAVRNLEELSRNHIITVGEIGQAHRAAADYPSYNEVKEVKSVHTAQRAQERHAQALKRAKAETLRRNEESNRLQQIRHNVRVVEDFKAKSLVDRKPFRAKNIEPKPESVRDRLKRLGYQQSLAKTLHVPQPAAIQGATNTVPKKRPKKHVSYKRRKSPKIKPQPTVSTHVAALEMAANVHAVATYTELTITTTSPERAKPKHLSPRSGLRRHRGRKQKVMSSPGDVVYVSANEPLPPQKYKPPPGIAQRVTTNPAVPTAWDQAKAQSQQQEIREREAARVKTVIQAKTKQRGRKALKIARLEQRYKQLETELMSTIEEEEEETSGVSPQQSRPSSTKVPGAGLVARLNSKFENVMAAAQAQMASLMGEEMELIKIPEYRPTPIPDFAPIHLPTIHPPVPPPSASVSSRIPQPLRVPRIGPPSRRSVGETVPDAAASTKASPASNSMENKVYRKEATMHAYITVKEKLSELEEELKRRESQMVTGEPAGSSRSAAPVTFGADVVPPSPSQPMAPETKATGVPPSITVTPASTECLTTLSPSQPKTGTSPTAVRPTTNIPPSVSPAAAISTQAGADTGPMTAPGTDTIAPVVPPLAAHTEPSSANPVKVTSKKNKAPKVAVKKTQSKISAQRKRTNLPTSKATHVQKANKENVDKARTDTEGKAKNGTEVKPQSDGAGSEILRHFIQKLLVMDPDRVAKLSTSKLSSSSSSSKVHINSSAMSTPTSKSGSIASLHQWPPAPPQDASTPNAHGAGTSLATTPGLSSRPNESSLSSSFPNVDLNVYYDSDTTSKSKSTRGLAPPILRGVIKGPPPPADLQNLLATVCQRQVHCLSIPANQRTIGLGECGQSEVNLDEHNISGRFARLMSNVNVPDRAFSHDEVLDQHLRGGSATSTTSPLGMRQGEEGLIIDEFAVSPVTGVDNRGETIPPMIGQVVKEWRKISIVRPEWSE